MRTHASRTELLTSRYGYLDLAQLLIDHGASTKPSPVQYITAADSILLMGPWPPLTSRLFTASSAVLKAGVWLTAVAR